MPRPKTRNKVDIEIDIALFAKIEDFQKLWKATFGQEITRIEMTRLFGEFAELDLGKIRQMGGLNGYNIHDNGNIAKKSEKAYSRAN